MKDEPMSADHGLFIAFLEEPCWPRLKGHIRGRGGSWRSIPPAGNGAEPRNPLAGDELEIDLSRIDS